MNEKIERPTTGEDVRKLERRSIALDQDRKSGLESLDGLRRFLGDMGIRLPCGQAMGDIKRLRAQVSSLESERDALKAIVERYTEETKDGVRVGYRDWVWARGSKVRVLLDTTCRPPILYVPVGTNDEGDWRDMRPSECYSTREAAEAAAKEANDE